MKKWFLFFIFSTQIHANYLEDNFSRPAVLEILKTCFSDYYDCKLLMKKTGDQKSLILLVGENHENPYEALAQGRMLFEYFDHFGYESGIGRHLNFLPQIMRVLAVNLAKSSGYGKLWGHKLPYTPGHSLIDEKWPNKFDIEQGCPSAYNFSQAKRDAAMSVILSSGLAGLFYFQTQDFYPFFAGAAVGLVGSIVSIAKGVDDAFGRDYIGENIVVRDANMARNISAYISEKAINPKPKVHFAVGTAHLYGITKNLVIVHDFEDRTQDLMTTYRSFIKSEFGEYLYQNTIIRDLTKLTGSFFGPRLKEWILKCYKDSILKPIQGVDY